MRDAQKKCKISGKFFLLLFLISFLAGCRTLETPKSPSELWAPSEKYTRGHKVEAEDIFKTIQGKIPDTKAPLGFADLVGIALENNPVTREAWQRSFVAKAQVGSARSTWYPKINVEQNFQNTRNISHRQLRGLSQGDIGSSLQMTYLLLDFGGRNAKIEQAYQLLIASNFQFNQTIQDLLLGTATAYFNFYAAVALRDAAEMDVKDAKATWQATVEKFNAGIQQKLDVLESNSSYQKTLYKLEDAKGQIKTAEGQLAKALGIPAGTPLNINLPEKNVEFKVGERTVNQLIEEGLIKRPDLAAERASLAAKVAAIKAAKSALWPTLNAQVTGDNNWYRYWGQTGLNYSNEYAYGYTAGASVNWNIFEGFDTISKIQAAEADAKARFEFLRQREIGATADVWEKYYNFVTAIRKLEFSKAYEEASQGAYDLAMTSYKSGLKDIIDLLNAESALSDARSQLINSRRGLYISFAQLVHATGTINERTDAEKAQPGDNIKL